MGPGASVLLLLGIALSLTLGNQPAPSRSSRQQERSSTTAIAKLLDDEESIIIYRLPKAPKDKK